MIKTIIFFTIFTTFTATALPQLLPHRFTPDPLSLPVRPYIPKDSKPLCKSQLNLANYACGLLPYATLPPPSPPPPPPPRRHHHHHSRPHRRGRHHPPPPHHHGRHHPPPPPPPPPFPHAADDEDDNDNDNDNDNDYDDDDDEVSRRRHRRSHHHHHHHHRSHRHSHHNHNHNQGTAAEQECCRWLKELDSECVCSLMVHLPPFMTRPVHQYTVRVDSVCHVTYSCSSTLLS